MKILFTIKAMEGIKGGAERVLAQIANGLAGRGHEVVLLTFDKTGSEPFYPVDSKVRRICLGLGRPWEKAGPIETLQRVAALRASVQKEDPDCVVGFMHSMFVPLSFALLGTGVPVIGSEHIVPRYYRDRRFEFLLLILSGLLMRRMTVLSEKIKRLYPAILHRRMVCISNPVHIPEAESKGFAKNGNSKIILNVGRLTAQKDQKTLISAFSLIAAEFPDWTLRIIGEGELLGDLNRQVRDCRLEGRVILAGSTDDIAREYALASIFIMPSLYESFGLATVEAMAFGLPVIGFADCPGTNELIVDGKNGFLADGRDRVSSLAKKMAVLICSEELRHAMGEEGKKVSKNFSPDKIVGQWENIIREVSSS